MFELNKIGFVKRASALLLDAILLAVLSTGFMYIVSLICHYSEAEAKAYEYSDQRNAFVADYIPTVSRYYGFVYEETEDGSSYTITTEDGKAASIEDVLEKLVNDEDRSAEMQEAYAAYEDLPPMELFNAQVQLVLTMLFMMVSIGVLLAYLVLEFIIPIILKNGQTVGKKVFSIGLVKPNLVKINNLSLFARTFIGKFAIETMFPILLVFLFMFGGLGWVAIVLFVAITLLNIILFFVTKNKTPIHDVLAGTVAVDLKIQLTFNSEEEIAEKKALLQNDSEK